MKRRSYDSDNDVTDQEIKRQRASAFDWAQLLLPNAPILVKILLLLGLGAGTAVTAPKVLQTINGTPPVAEGEVVVPHGTAVPPEVLQSLQSMDAAIKKLQARAAALETASKSGDTALEARVARIEGVVQ